MVFRRALFQHQTKLIPESLIFFVVIFCQFFQHLQGTLRQRGAQALGHAAILQYLTGDVQRQIIGVNQATHKTQIVRHKLLSVIHDKDALYVEFQAMFLIAVPHIKWRTRRNVEQAGIFLLTFHPIVAPGDRIAVIVGDMLVELVVLFVADLRFVAGPQRLGFVNLLPVCPFAFFIFAFDLNRQRDVIRIFADDVAHAPCIQELILAFAQMQGDLGTAIGFLNLSQGIFALACGFPEHAFFG